MMGPGPVDVLAEHEGVRLTRDDASDAAHRFEVQYRDGSGELRRSGHPHDRMIDAIHEYHACVVRTASGPIAAVMELAHRFNVAMCEHDVEALEPLMADEYRHLDHRPIGYPELTKQGQLDTFAANRDMAFRGLARTYHVLSERGLVRTSGFWTEIHGDWNEFEIGIYLTVVSDARVERTETFQVDHLDDAARRFRSLTATPPR